MKYSQFNIDVSVEEGQSEMMFDSDPFMDAIIAEEVCE